MSFRKFGPNDIVLNTMRAYPQVRFNIYSTKVYYNSTPHQSGAFSDNILNITSSTSGGVSLYEQNIDRAGGVQIAADESVTTTGFNPPISPYITKDSARASFRSAGKLSFNNEFQFGDVIQANYPLTASITRVFMSPLPGARAPLYDDNFDPARASTVLNRENNAVEPVLGPPKYRQFYALKNRLNEYGYMSQHYVVSSSLGWNKANQPINLIDIPSIFYGSKMKEGTVSLRYYISGALKAEVRDTKENGELIQVSGSASDNGKVAGVVLYNEGMILLTGSWDINDQLLPLVNGTTAGGLVTSKWIYFGAGANDGITSQTVNNVRFASASFEIVFNGTTETQVQTMFAHAHRGQVNHSNNPTYVAFNQSKLLRTGSQVYEENPVLRIKNTVSSSFASFDAPFKRQVYISRVAIYDDMKNLIGIATLADPVLKEEEQDYTFKLKLDI